MNDPRESEFEALHHAALEIARRWSPTKATMALRAAGFEQADGERTTLDAIAADLGVSRETVRRARNELLQAIKAHGATSDAIYSSLSLHIPSEPSADTPATARALRRLLTIAGPMPWDEVVSAWSRAGGKPPYSPLPEDVASMITWAAAAGGFSVTTTNGSANSATISVVILEELDQVSQFLVDTLRERTEGVNRAELLELAAEAGLKPTTIATALSVHPAVRRVSRGIWALRGRLREASSGQDRIAAPRRAARVRPTTFTWGVDGSLLIEFSIPRGPSPVVAVPKAISAVIEGREFCLEEGAKQTRVTVRNARLWGFGALLPELGLPGGARVTIALNLLTSKATISPVEGKETN